MNIKIIKIIEPGIGGKERLWLKVGKTTDIGNYMVFNTSISDKGTFKSKPTHVYWFPNGIVEEGDEIFLYTKGGVRTTRKRDDGTTVHIYYWKNEVTIWNSKDSGAVLIEAKNWQAKIRS